MGKRGQSPLALAANKVPLLSKPFRGFPQKRALTPFPLIVILLFASLSMRLAGIDCGYVYAGDELDYSAPYITVENGELITRYPAKEHATGDAAVQPNPGKVAETPKKEPISLLLWGLPAAVAILVFAGFRSRRHRQNQKIDSAS